MLVPLRPVNALRELVAEVARLRACRVPSEAWRLRLRRIASVLLLLLSSTSGILIAEPALLPDEIAPGVHILSSAYKMGSANVGWIELENSVLLVDAGHPEHLAKLLDQVKRTTGKPIRQVILTHARADQLTTARHLAAAGARLLAHPETAKALEAGGEEKLDVRSINGVTSITRDGFDLEIRSHGHVAGPGNLTVFMKNRAILFAGEIVQTSKPDFTRGKTELWIAALEDLRTLAPRNVVPGFGTPGKRKLVGQQLRYIRELRRQVCYLVSMMKPVDFVTAEIRRLGMPGPLLNWKPYDDPVDQDIAHMVTELTVPAAPFKTRPFEDTDKRPRALCVMGDRVHYPAHSEEGLMDAFDAAQINARIAFDPRALSADNLAQVDLFVILRDGTIWPENMTDQAHWLQKAQVDALRQFIRKGGGFLALHNSTALWRDDYVELLGGKYAGHGPLERFRVRVTDKKHPITRGVEDFEVADEQHWPIVDMEKVHAFLGNINEDGRAGVAGFEHELGKGRICYLAPGHTREAMEHPMFQKLMVNGMRWCVRRLVK